MVYCSQAGDPSQAPCGTSSPPKLKYLSGWIPWNSTEIQQFECYEKELEGSYLMQSDDVIEHLVDPVVGCGETGVECIMAEVLH